VGRIRREVMSMVLVGSDFPKCPICKRDMVSVTLPEVPTATRREMARYNRYQPLNPSYWYRCEDDNLVIHKLAVALK